MIPLVLRLRNFMSYGERVEPLDFGAFHIACLCGENGHGKSALLDAITWALWGRSRAKSEDDLVQLGKLDMEVQLEFALGAERYLVLRKRALRASGRRRIATPTLELQIADGDGYRSLTGDSVTATQTVIQGILRVDYETFINSAYMVQGRADEFTVKSPAERKRVLADLLGLDRYARLEERAREESRRCALERQTLQAAIADIDAELARRGEYEAQLQTAAERIRSAEERRRTADAELARWRAEQRASEERLTQLSDLRRRCQQDEQERGTLEAHLSNERRELERIEALLARRDEVAQALARLVELRQRDEQLSRQAAELIRLSAERGRLERAVAAAREQLVAELQVVRAEVARLQALAAQVDVLKRDLVTAEAELATFESVERQRDEQRERAQRWDVEAQTLRQTNDRLRAEMNGLKERLDMLGQAGAACPICQTKLTERGRAAAESHLESEGKARADEYRRNVARIKQLEADRANAEYAAQEMDKRLSGRSALEGRVATLRRAHDEAWQAAGAQISVVERASALEGRLQRGDFLPEEHRALAAVLERVDSIGYDQVEHDQLRAELARLRPYEALHGELTTAEAALEPARQRVRQTEVLLDARRASLRESAALLAQLEADGARAAEIETALNAASAAVDAAIAQSRDASQALGVAQQRIDHCRFLDGQRAGRVAAAAKAADEKSIYDDLALAFGKKGIQAMIIESAIPELEAEANDLLQRLTDGQLSIAFETQREAKTGDGLIETLDIRISDSYGTRDYELYSGGEAFRVNFAIRIALSKLLARRAGTQLQLLVIDEGFGTQDAVGRERLTEAINAISSEFEKIVVVTHIQELKDAFPVRIDVVKGPEGSQIVSTAVLDG